VKWCSDHSPAGVSDLKPLWTSLSLWQPSSQGPGQVGGGPLHAGGGVVKPSQLYSAHDESWEVQGILTDVGRLDLNQNQPYDSAVLPTSWVWLKLS